MKLTNKVYPIIAQVIDAATLVFPVSTPLNPFGLEAPCFYIRIVNNSDVGIYVSYDNVDLHDFIIPGTSLSLNFQANNQVRSQINLIAKETIVYIQPATASAPFHGDIVLTGYTSYREE